MKATVLCLAVFLIFAVFIGDVGAQAPVDETIDKLIGLLNKKNRGFATNSRVILNLAALGPSAKRAIPEIEPLATDMSLRETR